MRRISRHLILAVLIMVASGCASLPLEQKPQVQAIRPSIAGIDFEGLDLAFDVDVDNPYPVAIRTPRFNYSLDVEGTRFFESAATSEIDLPASGIGTVTLPARVSYSDLMAAYGNLAEKPEAAYTLQGGLVVPVLGRSLELPLSHSGTFPILRPPDFSNIKVQLPSVSLFKTKVRVDADMQNPNAFDLGIEDLGYLLKLGDVELGGLRAKTASSLGAGQTGQLSLEGEFSAASSIIRMIKGGNIGDAKILPSGSIQTPYGPVKLQ